jgi:superfamily I DNA/RNA helicase
MINKTKEQQKILDEARKSQTIAIKAFAGTGKTTTLKMISEDQAECKILYLAFNTESAKEARGRFLENTTCKTVHSLALSELKESGFKPSFENVNVYSVKNYLEKVHKGKVIGFGTAKKAYDKLNEFLYSESTDFGKEYFGYDGVYAKEVFNAMLSGDFPTGHDGYLKIYHLWLVSGKINPPKIDILMLDEAQDSNHVTVSIFNSIKCRTKIMVGDPHQQIYAWRGSKNVFKELNKDVKILPLTKTYRFPQSHVDKANRLLKSEKNEIEEIRTIKELGSEDNVKTKCIITRTNSAMLEIILENEKLPEEKRIIYKTMRPSSEILADSLDLLKIKSNGSKKTPKKDLTNKDWSTYTYSKIRKEVSSKVCNDQPLKIAFKLVEKYGEKIIDAKKIIDSNRRKKSENYTTITTTHTAKGLEWDEVTIYNDFTPYFAIKGNTKENKEKRDEEINLYYVAMTRSKEVLIDNTNNILSEFREIRLV